MSVKLKLDNGDEINGAPGGGSAQLVRCQQLIEQDRLSSEEQSRRLQHITQIYQRLQPAVPPTPHVESQVRSVVGA